MPKDTPLTAKEVAHLKQEGTYAIGSPSCLYLRIRESGSKYFMLRYRRLDGTRKAITIGKYPEVSLKEARLSAMNLLSQIALGVDPAQAIKEQAIKEKEERKKAFISAQKGLRTVQTLADEWITERSLSGYWANNIRGESVARSYFKNHINPMIGNIPIADLTPHDVFTMLKPIWQTTTDTGENCKSAVFQLFRWAKAKGYCSQENPADIKGTLGVLLEPLKTGRKKTKHCPALAFEELPDFVNKLINNGSTTYLMLTFSILTALRSKMVRLAKWADLDLEEKTLNIPNENFKTKGRGDHTVYLSPEALYILSLIPRNSNTYIFTTPRSKDAFSDASMSTIFKKLHERRYRLDRIGWVDPIQTKKEGHPVIATQHGTARATFKTWCSTGENRKLLDPEAVELCLAHKLQDDYDGAYNRAHLKEERIEVMNAWGSFCFSKLQK